VLLAILMAALAPAVI
jgi:hypothetical protein